MKFRCVLIITLILPLTLVTGHSIHRRDSQNNDESDGDRVEILKRIGDMLKQSAQNRKGSMLLGLLTRSRTSPVDSNDTSESSSSAAGSGAMDDDMIVFNDDGPDVTALVMTTADDDSGKQVDATTVPTILNRSLLDTPIACGGGQQLGKDGKCRVVW